MNKYISYVAVSVAVWIGGIGVGTLVHTRTRTIYKEVPIPSQNPCIAIAGMTNGNTNGLYCYTPNSIAGPTKEG